MRIKWREREVCKSPQAPWRQAAIKMKDRTEQSEKYPMLM